MINWLFLILKKSHSDAAHLFFQCLTMHPREIFFISKIIVDYTHKKKKKKKDVINASQPQLLVIFHLPKMLLKTKTTVKHLIINFSIKEHYVFSQY